ncbi:MAG: hypothetical protein ACFE75_11940 [Candidatus Hodarchaeota archaeon]
MYFTIILLNSFLIILGILDDAIDLPACNTASSIFSFSGVIHLIKCATSIDIIEGAIQKLVLKIIELHTNISENNFDL